MAVGHLLAGGIGISLSALVGLTSLLPYLPIAPVQLFCGMDVLTSNSMLMFALLSCSPIQLTIIAQERHINVPKWIDYKTRDQKPLKKDGNFSLGYNGRICILSVRYYVNIRW